MAKPYKIPDFRKLYPEASEEVIAVLRTTERDLAEELKIYHNAVHKRKNRILKKLKNILENL